MLMKMFNSRHNRSFIAVLLLTALLALVWQLHLTAGGGSDRSANAACECDEKVDGERHFDDELSTIACFRADLDEIHFCLVFETALVDLQDTGPALFQSRGPPVLLL